jgi:hypothetical protein
MAKLERKDECPIWKEKCHGLDCAWYVCVRGKNPQSEEIIDEWGCAITWLPTLLINTAQEVRQGAAATESFRNEVVQRADESDLVKLARISETIATPPRLINQERNR